MKKLLAIVLTLAMVLSIGFAAFAYGDPTGGQQQTAGYYDSSGRWISTGTQQQAGYYDSSGRWIANSNNGVQYGYPTQSWYTGYNNSNNYYSGEIYGNNYNQQLYGQTYYLSDWTSLLQSNYNQPKFYESAQREVKRGEAFFLSLRIIQKTLSERGYATLQSGYQKPPFWDMEQLVPNSQSEANILWTKGILIGYNDQSMKMSQTVTRAEFAAIFNRVNRLFLNMPATYGYSNFSDTQGHWAAQDISQAVACGVLKGVDYNNFAPEAPLTIEQIWAISDRYVGQNGIRRSNVADAMNLTFNVKFTGPYVEDYTGNDWNNNGQKISSISMQDYNVSLKYQETKTISARIYPSTLLNVRIDWRSSNTSIVSVEEIWYSNGVAYAKIKGRMQGNVSITARTLDGTNLTGTTNVTVENTNYQTEVTRLEATSSSITIAQGSTKDVSVRIYPGTADNKILKWTSSDSNIAYIQNFWTSGSYGYATVRGVRDGSTSLRVETTDGGYVTITIYVNVTDNPNYEVLAQDITIGNQNVTVLQGQSIQLSANVYPSNATNKTLQWDIDNTNVATVNNNGTLYGVNVGNCTVTVRTVDGSNIRKYFYVTVTANSTPTPYLTPPPTQNDTVKPVVELLGAGSIRVGQTITLTARASDNVGISNFIMVAQSVKGLTAGLVVRDVRKTSATEYSIVLYAVEVGQQGIAISPGVAVDVAGNTSDWSSECVVTVIP